MSRHALSITGADGRVTRWAPDAPEDKRPHGLRWSTVMPGGYRSLECDLLRDRADGFDLRRFDDVRAYGPGNTTRWNGRQAEFPSQTDELKVSPAAEGYAAALEDNQAFRRLYIDRDLTRWTPESRARRLSLLAANVRPSNEPTIAYSPDGGDQMLQLSLLGAFGGATNSEMQYDAGPGVYIGSISMGYELGSTVDGSNANWSGFVGLDTDENPSGGNVGQSADLLVTSPGSLVIVTASDPARYAYAYIRFAAAGGGDGTLYPVWYKPVVFGYGIPATITGAGGLTGIVASELLADVLRNAAPGLTFTTGENGSIQPSTFAIPHLVFRDPLSAGAAVQQINRYDLRPWFVWEDRRFYWHELERRGSTWRARIGKGARLKLEGETSEDVYTGVVVKYRDAAGRERLVGPTGSGVGSESSFLTVTDPANDAVAHGIKRVALIDLPVITDATGAIQIGNLWLAEANAKRNRGEIVLTGEAADDKGVTRDVAEVRAGDRMEVPDRDDVTRVIISTDYDDDSQQLTAALDSTPHTLDALYERLGVSLIGVVE